MSKSARSAKSRSLDFKPKEHFELGEALGLMDFEAASRMSGARFVVLKGKLARLERALAQFMLDLHTDEHGYQEVAPPLLVRDDAMFGTAQLPKFMRRPVRGDSDMQIIEEQFRDSFRILSCQSRRLTRCAHLTADE